MTATINKIERVPMEEIEAIVEKAKASLSAEEHRKLKAAMETLTYLTSEIEDKRTTIRSLRELLFGSKSEKTENVLGRESAQNAAEPEAQEEADAEEDGDGYPGEEKRDPARKKRKGHGRNGAKKYTGAETIEVAHERLKSGDACPAENCDGRVYRQSEPAVLVRIEGQAPLSGKVYKLEKLRCSLCLTVFTAKPPEAVGTEKYDETAVSMMALLRYGGGMPLNRLEDFQKSLGIPLPASTQWDVVRGASPGFAPAFDQLIRDAAQGKIVHNDDTPMPVLEIMKENRERRNRGDPPDRTGMYTTGIVSVKDERKIAVFFTGRKHAGENLSRVLAERAAELGPPIQMCDALSRNVSGDFETILSNCMSHARRGYVKIVEDFPQECRFVLETLRVVFKNDAIARREKMTAEQRLAFHRKESMRPMAELRLWAYKQLRDHRVEPNSGLGRAIAYMRRHWRKLTRFLFVAGAPLQNNICERLLKQAIRHRRNSLFYKTENGARVGDMYMSLIATCKLAGENPFDYLTELQRHAAAVRDNPADWMPWNYRATLRRLSAEA